MTWPGLAAAVWEALGKLFAAVLGQCLPGGAVILVILALRQCMARLPRRYAYVLWLAAALRLALPVLPQAPWSVFNLLPERTAAGLEEPGEGEANGRKAGAENLSLLGNLLERWETGADGTAGYPAAVTAEDKAGGEAARETAARAEGQTGGIGGWLLARLGEAGAAWAIRTALVLWLLGMAFMLVWAVVSGAHVRRLRARAVRWRENIYACDGNAAFTAGILPPKIYLPAALCSDWLGAEAVRRREHILRHEQSHIRRRDYLVKPAAFLLLTVYWFHPLVWIAWQCMCRDMEMSCDERVVERMNMEEKKEYARTLLASAREKKSLFLPAAFGRTDVSGRIQHALRACALGGWKRVAVSLGVAAVFCVLCTDRMPLAAGEFATGQAGDESAAVSEAADPAAEYTAGQDGDAPSAAEYTAGQDGDASTAVIGGADGPTSVLAAGQDGDTSTAIIGGADGPTAIFLVGTLHDGDPDEVLDAGLLEVFLPEDEADGATLDLASHLVAAAGETDKGTREYYVIYRLERDILGEDGFLTTSDEGAVQGLAYAELAVEEGDGGKVYRVVNLMPFDASDIQAFPAENGDGEDNGYSSSLAGEMVFRAEQARTSLRDEAYLAQAQRAMTLELERKRGEYNALLRAAVTGKELPALRLYRELGEPADGVVASYSPRTEDGQAADFLCLTLTDEEVQACQSAYETGENLLDRTSLEYDLRLWNTDGSLTVPPEQSGKIPALIDERMREQLALYEQEGISLFLAE